MTQTIKLKRGTTTPTTSNIVDGEVAIDTAAQKLYVNDGGTVKEVSPVSVAFDDLTGKDSGTGTYATTGQIQAGKGNGGVSLTHNDGYGHANVCFNHSSGIPEQNGNAGRIVVNTDSTTNANIKFEVQSNVTSGVVVDPTIGMEVREAEVQIPGNLVHTGDADTYLRFTADRIRLYAGGTVKVDTNDTYLTPTVTNSVTFNDNVTLNIGTGNDLQFVHDGTTTTIDNTNSGTFFIKSAGSIAFRDRATDLNYITMLTDGTTNLFYAGGVTNEKKLVTNTDGIDVIGVTQTDQLRLTDSNVPSSATDTGTAGDIAIDANYIYICTAANTWKRAAISTW